LVECGEALGFRQGLVDGVEPELAARGFGGVDGHGRNYNREGFSRLFVKAKNVPQEN
jgi:hypothetical protein